MVMNSNGVAMQSIAELGCSPVKEVRSSVPEVASRNALEKLASSVTLSRAEQLRRLLRWLGERSLSTNPVSPSEKEIAEEVLQRRDFDPQADSLVRKEMSRLREKISRYYQSEGRADSVIVTASNGYLLRFEPRGDPDPNGQRPGWLILPFRTTRDEGDLGHELLEELLLKIADKGGPDLVSPGTAMAYGERLTDLRQLAADCQVNFVVEGSLRHKEGCITAVVWFVDGGSGRISRSRRVSGADAPQLADSIATWLLDAGSPQSGPACQ